MINYIKISEQDNVVVALCNLEKGRTIDEINITLTEDIKQGHKFALCDIAQGENIIKYGNPIGRALSPIKKGTAVHTHNLKTNLEEDVHYCYNPSLSHFENLPPESFMGFRRTDGKLGIRNEIWIIPSVGCVNSVAAEVARRAKTLTRGSVGEVVAFSHPYGCSQMGEDQENTKKILADLALHPNAGGVLLLGLGCENCGVETIKPYLGDFDQRKIRFLSAQDIGDEIEHSLKIIKELIDYAADFEREPISCEHLIVGLKCGGSDGLSGITANPVVGAFSDALIARGGSCILTEVPEMFGAETLLFNRCRDREVFDRAVCMINDFKDYYIKNDQVVYENPSPGNKQGGISTLEDKSLGCTQKSGSATVQDVLCYGERVKCRGLSLLSAPGNDLVASSALAASGAQIVLFTTGRGTPFASPVPTLKISSNTALYNKKSNWIDFNAGEIVDGVSIDEMQKRLFESVLRVASGETVRAEQNGYHDMAIFKKGVTL